MKPQIQAFFDDATWTVSYVVYDQPGGHCALVDSVLDYDPKSGRTRTHSAERLIEFVQTHGLTVEWILETHAHADHLSAAHYLRNKLGGALPLAPPSHRCRTYSRPCSIWSLSSARTAASLTTCCMTTRYSALASLRPKHWPYPATPLPAWPMRWVTPCSWATPCSCPMWARHAVTFQGGRTPALSIGAQAAEPAPETRLYMCHDYPPAGRATAWQTTVADQRAHNIHVHDGVTEDAFVALRTRRDATLEMPTLILPSVQVNIRAGAMPPTEDNGVAYLKIPVNAL